MFKKSALKNLIKPIIFVLCGLLIAVAIWQYNENKLISLHYLDQQATTHTLFLPVKDRKRLVGLMQHLFAEDSFAYTILGSKPVSWGSYHNPLPFSSWTSFCNAFSKYNRTLRIGWKTWEKYQHLFPSVHFWVENSQCYPGSMSILIVNEEQFNKVVTKHRGDFEKVLGRTIVNGSQLIKEAKDHSLMNEILEGHQALLGIVLGYGRDNSWQFLEGCNERRRIGWVWSDEKSYFGEETIDSDSCDIDYYLSHYSCPSFAGDPNSAESLALKADYSATKQKVLAYYKNKDFLEATLSLLAGHL